MREEDRCLDGFIRSPHLFPVLFFRWILKGFRVDGVCFVLFGGGDMTVKVLQWWVLLQASAG